MKNGYPAQTSEWEDPLVRHAHHDSMVVSAICHRLWGWCDRFPRYELLTAGRTPSSDAPHRSGRRFFTHEQRCAVYHLNGLDLPRSSRQQWKSGRPVKHSQLAKGDLVFFATLGGTRVSHVGIYTGSGKFLHAPRRGRKITISSLSSTYYKTRYLGARSYL
jgi:hypothetical protein